jgi:hypothetical protein
MALTVSEAAAVNTLLRAVYGPLPYDEGELPQQERVDEAALLLAEHANKTLHAGWSREHLERKIAARDRTAMAR